MFGEDANSLKKITSEDFFGIFNQLNTLVAKYVKDEEERLKKEARKAAMAAKRK